MNDSDCFCKSGTGRQWLKTEPNWLTRNWTGPWSGLVGRRPFHALNPFGGSRPQPKISSLFSASHSRTLPPTAFFLLTTTTTAASCKHHQENNCFQLPYKKSTPFKRDPHFRWGYEIKKEALPHIPRSTATFHLFTCIWSLYTFYTYFHRISLS